MTRRTRKLKPLSPERRKAILDAFNAEGVDMTPEGLSRLREAFREAGVGFYKFRVRKKPATKVAVGPDPARPKTVYVRFGRNVPRKKHTSAGGKQLSFEF